ncbi:MAG TPA: hypothetical protein VEA41_08955 [Salinarimonas sp.]|jgi:hypothetical protein|nr:hypothetical protein [Salinarimonas sp.]
MHSLETNLDTSSTPASGPSFVKASIGFLTSTTVVSTVMVLLGSL